MEDPLLGEDDCKRGNQNRKGEAKKKNLIPLRDASRDETVLSKFLVNCCESELGACFRSSRALLLIFFLIIAIFARLFFCYFLDNQVALAKNNPKENIELSEIEPLSKIGLGFIKKDCSTSNRLCSEAKQNNSVKGNLRLVELVKGYPIAEMLPEINKLDIQTADYLIAIAKKESGWGKHAPSKNGQDCYNYWGYKGASEEQVMGYSCFSSREEAVEKVGARIQKLLRKGLDSPERFIVWKCGSTCAGHDPTGVAKWIADVKLVLNSLKS